MFDVSWSTPTETVAAHRSRKAHNSSSSSSSKPDKRSSLISSTSSSSSTKPSTRGISVLGLLTGGKKQKGEKKIAREEYKITNDEASRVNLDRRSSSETNTTEDSRNDDLKRSCEHLDGGLYLASHARESTVTERTRSSLQSSSSPSPLRLVSLDAVQTDMPADSISSTYISPWTPASSYCHPHSLDISTKHEFQPLSPRSFVIRSTEVAITTKDVAASLQQPTQEVHISSSVPNDFSLDANDSPTEK